MFTLGSHWVRIGHVDFMLFVHFPPRWATNANVSLVEYGLYSNNGESTVTFRESTVKVHCIIYTKYNMNFYANSCQIIVHVIGVWHVQNYYIYRKDLSGLECYIASHTCRV